MKQLIQRHATGRKVFFLFVTTNIIYAVMIFITIPKVMAFAGGMKLLDMLPTGYNADYVTILFSKLGVEGRHAYLWNQLPVDMIYPGLFAISYCLLMAFLLQKIERLSSPMYYLCLLPLGAGIADYLENFTIIYMLNVYPKIGEISMIFSNAFTLTKSMLTSLYFLCLIIVMAMTFLFWMRKRRELLSPN